MRGCWTTGSGSPAHRFGLDGLIGLVPGLGDVATALVSLYIVARAQALGVPAGVFAIMLGNILIDTTVGAIPVPGDVFDVAFKANRRDLGLLRRAPAAADRRQGGTDAVPDPRRHRS